MYKDRFIVIIVIAIIALLSINAFAQTKCMYVYAPGRETEDSTMVANLEAWGYLVETHVDTDLVYYTQQIYDMYDFIFLSESIPSGNAWPLMEMPLPMVNSEGWSVKNGSLRWSAAPTGDHVLMTEPELQGIKMLEASAGHLLAAGMAPGTLITPCDTSDLVVYGKPDIDHVPIAALASDTTWLFAYGVEAGTAVYDTNLTIQNRCAMVGVHALGYPTLSSEAVDLYKAAIDWVLDEPLNYTCMYVYAPGRETEDSTMVANLESWGCTVTTHVDTDLVYYTQQIYDLYDFIFLSESIPSGNAWPLMEMPIPMVNSEGWSVKNGSLRWSAAPTGDHVLMTEPELLGIKFLAAGEGHDLAAGIRAGTLIDVCDTTDLVVYGKPDIDVTPIAALASDTTWLLVYGVEAGTAVYDTNLTIQNRCAMVGVHALGFPTLTLDGIKLFKSAIKWVMAGTPNSINGAGNIVADQYKLNQNYPNPFNPETNISFYLPKQSKVKLTVWNALGQKIATLVNGVVPAGEQSVNFKASHLPSGIYFYKLEADNNTFTKKMLLLK